MRRLASVVLTGGLVLGAATVASARCEDAAAVAAARAAAAGPCNCALATNHGDYVSCVADFAQTFPGLPSNCRGEVVRCAAHSTCGKEGATRCCRTDRRGRTKCSIKRSADRCRAPRGGTATASGPGSCCDGCGVVTTTTAVPTSTTAAPTTTTAAPTTTTQPGSPSQAFLIE
jgi:hypothetical protein